MDCLTFPGSQQKNQGLLQAVSTPDSSGSRVRPCSKAQKVLRVPAGGVWALAELLCRGHDSPGTVHRPAITRASCGLWAAASLSSAREAKLEAAVARALAFYPPPL